MLTTINKSYSSFYHDMALGSFTYFLYLVITVFICLPLYGFAQPSKGSLWLDEPKVPENLAVKLGGGVKLIADSPLSHLPPFFGNTLFLLISTGLQNNPAVQSKVKLTEASKFGVDAAKWQFYPTPIASIDQARTSANDPSYQGTNRVFQLGLQQPIWTGGRLTAGLTLAEKQLAVAFADLQDSKEQLTLKIVSAFASWTSAHEKVTAYEANVKLHQDLQALIRNRINAGLSPESDFVFSRGRLDQALADLEMAKTQRANALTSLSQQLGTSIEGSDLISITRPLLNYRIERGDMLKNALEIRPSILKARAQVEIQDSQIAIAKSSVSPSISLSLQRQDGNFSYSNVATNVQNRAFLSLSTSFGAGLSNFSQIASAIAQREAALSDEEAAKRNISEEIISDIALIQASEYRVRSMQFACEAASSTESSWRRQFLAGKKAWQDLLNSTRELASCRTTLADSKQSLLNLNWRLAVFSMGLDRSLDLAGLGN